MLGTLAINLIAILLPCPSHNKALMHKELMHCLHACMHYQELFLRVMQLWHNTFEHCISPEIATYAKFRRRRYHDAARNCDWMCKYASICDSS